MMDSSSCLGNSSHDELVSMAVQALTVLQRKFPLPACLRADMITVDIFSSHGASSTLLTNGIVYYLICIADQSVGRTIQWPIGSQSMAKFNQSILKALGQIMKDNQAFQLSNRVTLGTILRDRKGPKFNKFIFELARNAVRITSLSQGSRLVPQVAADPDEDTMRRTVDKLGAALAQKRMPASEESDTQLLQELDLKKEELKSRAHELIQMCPSKYKDLMNENGPADGNAAALNVWQTDLNEISNEQARKSDLLAAHNRHVGDIRTLLREKLNGEDLINAHNGPILVKTANENNIELFQEDRVSLSGFMECSIVIARKLKTLVANVDSQHIAREVSVPLETGMRTLSKMKEELSEGERRVARLIEQSVERRQQYDEIINAEGGHKFPLPDLSQEVRVDSPAAPYSPTHLIQSPGIESPQRVLDEAKKRVRGAAADGAAGSDGPVNTPKSSGASNRSRTANSSMSKLTKSVLQKQTLSSTMASHANSTVGDILPLCSSSPVSSGGNGMVPAGPPEHPRAERPSLAEMLNELEESNLDFWDLSEESYVVNSTLDSPEAPPSQEDKQLGAPSRLPVPRIVRASVDQKPTMPSKLCSAAACSTSPHQGLAATSVAPSEPNVPHEEAPNRRPSTAPAASPARRPRRSIQNLIDRLQKIKASRGNNSQV